MADPVPDNKASEAVEFMRQANDAESENRNLGLTWLKFRYGEQWPQYAVASRGLDRPQLTINETNTYIKKVVNQIRQMRPRGKATPVDSFADKRVAKVITGLGRHIEVNSDADAAYITAVNFAATIGWGYWRLYTDYIAPDSFDQDIYIGMIDNPFSVYFDFMSKELDGSDAQRALITDLVRKEAFEKQYPGAQLIGFGDRGSGDSDPDWVTVDSIRIAEYYYLDRVKQDLVMLSNRQAVWADELEKYARVIQENGLTVIGDRSSYKTRLKWRKQTYAEVLEERDDLPGRYIPIVPTYWERVWIESRREVMGLVKDAMDPAQMNNFWQTAITEYLALAPKSKWLMAEGQDEGHENEFTYANLSTTPVLRYKQTDVTGRDAPPPQRVQAEPPPGGLIEATFMSAQNLSRVMGVFDPAVRGGAQHKSDKTLNAEAGQSEMTNFEGYDNFCRSVKHTWRIMLSWFGTVYDTPRTMRIIGDDGKPDTVKINDAQAADKILNDVRVGQYDVVMETGPGFDTKRKEGVAAMLQLMETPIGEEVAKVGADILVRMMDFDGSDVLADRLKAANPLAQIDEQADIPPQAQMMIKALQGQVQQLQGALQGAEIEHKFGMQKESMRQDAETRRTLIRETGRIHTEEMRDTTKQHDVEARALTAQNVAEINGIVDLLLHHMDTSRLQKEIELRDKEQERKAGEKTPADQAA